MAYTQQVGKKHRGVYRDRNGRKHYSALVLSRQAALAWAVQQEQRVKAGMDPAAGSMQLREWAELWKSARVVAETTGSVEATRIEAVIAEWGEWRLDTITTMAIQGWAKRLGQARAPGTVRKYVYALSSMLTAAVHEGLRADNPCRHVKLERPPKGKRVYLRPDELDRVVAHLADPYDTVGYVKAYTGLRWGELAGLPVRNIDFLKKELYVRQTLIQPDGAPRKIKPYPKTDESYRTIGLPEHAIKKLADHLRRHPSPDGLVFHGRRGNTMDRHYFAKIWKDACEAAGVQRARPHDLRHTNASWLVQAEVSIYEVQDHLGHGDLATTRLYAHLADGHRKRIRKALERPELGDAEASS